MNHDMYLFKLNLIKKINKQAKEERENERMNEAELSMWPLLCVVVILALIAFFTGAR